MPPWTNTKQRNRLRRNRLTWTGYSKNLLYKEGAFDLIIYDKAIDKEHSAKTERSSRYSRVSDLPREAHDNIEHERIHGMIDIDGL